MRVWGSYWWSSNCWLSGRQPEIIWVGWVGVRRAASPAVLSSKTTDWIRHSLSQGHVLHIPCVGASSTARCVFTWTWDLMFHGWPCRITAELQRDSFCCIEEEPSYTLGVSLNTPISHNFKAWLKLWEQEFLRLSADTLAADTLGTRSVWDRDSMILRWI